MEQIKSAEDILVRDGLGVFTGEEVMGIFRNPEFINQWEGVYQACEWSTLFQRPVFVIEWYKAFATDHLPILVYQQSKGRLVSMLTLVKERGGQGTITGAGKSDALYQTWISTEEDKSSFITQALVMMRSKFKKNDIVLSCVPDKVPMEWAYDEDWLPYCEVKPINRPLIDLTEEVVGKLTRKKQFRECTNKLKRLGNFTFDRITDAEEIEFLLDALAIQYDFRQGAVHNRTPFRNAKGKKEFYLSMLKNNVFFLTVIRVDGELVSATMGGFGSGGWVFGTGANSFSVHYVKFSPGILNFIMMAQCLMEMGYSVLDMSIGGQAYKDRLINRSDTVYKLTVSPQKKTVLKKQIKRKIETAVNVAISKMFKNPKVAKWEMKKKWGERKEKIQLIKRHGMGTWMKEKLLQRNETKESLFALAASSKEHGAVPRSGKVRQNALKDLLEFQPDSRLVTKQEFLFECMKRVEGGSIPLTWLVEGKLMTAVWLGSEQDKAQSEFKSSLGKDSIYLHGLYVHKDGAKYLPAFLSAVYSMISGNATAQKVYLSAKEDITKAYGNFNGLSLDKVS
ncbi:hypothetical protein GCM10028791_10920 [Echinicola sediminis]